MPKTSPPSCTVRTVSVFAVIWEAETACAAAFSGSGRPMSPHTESISKAAVPTLAANVRMPSKSEMSRRFGACGCGSFSKFKSSHLLAEKFRKLKRAFCFYAERKVFAAIKNTFAQRRKSLRKGDRFWSAALPASQHPAEDSGVKNRGNIGRNELFPIFGSAQTLWGSSARLSTRCGTF